MQSGPSGMTTLPTAIARQGTSAGQSARTLAAQMALARATRNRSAGHCVLGEPQVNNETRQAGHDAHRGVDRHAYEEADRHKSTYTEDCQERCKRKGTRKIMATLWQRRRACKECASHSTPRRDALHEAARRCPLISAAPCRKCVDVALQLRNKIQLERRPSSPRTESGADNGNWRARRDHAAQRDLCALFAAAKAGEESVER